MRVLNHERDHKLYLIVATHMYMVWGDKDPSIGAAIGCTCTSTCAIPWELY
jgi:hypothetical protein